MNTLARLRALLAPNGAGALRGASLLTRLVRWRRKDPEEIERLRRLDVHRRGRITAGQIVDLVEPQPPAPSARFLVYKYEVAGVTYELSQDVSSLPEAASLAPQALGEAANVKYDPTTPANSIIACEEWCGLRPRNRGTGLEARVKNQKSEIKNQKRPESDP